MNQSRPHSLVISLLTNLVLFGGLLTFCFPIFNSGDDVYLLYLLGGGFGQPPTELLHYHYGMHPYIGLLLKNLFISIPRFNWYTGMLYFFHFVSCTVLLYQLMRWNKKASSIFIYLLLFFCIEARFLLQPSFTNTALVTALGGALLWYDAFRNYSFAKILLGYVLLVAASMLRLHLLIPVIVIAVPFLIYKRAAIHLVVLAVLITASVFLQKQYYIKHIPGWEQEEAYRQTVIDHYNSPKIPRESLSGDIRFFTALLEFGILFDKELLSAQKIKETTEAIKLTSALQQPDFGKRLYWLMLESRTGTLLMLLVLFYKLPLVNRRQKITMIIAAGLLLAMCTALLLFRKLPPYVIPGCMLVWLAFAGAVKNNTTIPSPSRGCVFAIVGILLLCWSMVRLSKLNTWNKQQYDQWKCAYHRVHQFDGSALFIASDDEFPMDFLHVWHTPHKYPLRNLLYKDHFLNNTYQPIYKKFGIASPLQFLNNERVGFVGNRDILISKYYEVKYGISTIPHLPHISFCVDFWSLSR